MKELRNLEDTENPVNNYQIKLGKLYKNETETVDEFNLTNQLFV